MCEQQQTRQKRRGSLHEPGNVVCGQLGHQVVPFFHLLADSEITQSWAWLLWPNLVVRGKVCPKIARVAHQLETRSQAVSPQLRWEEQLPNVSLMNLSSSSHLVEQHWQTYLRWQTNVLLSMKDKFLSPSGDLGIGLVWHNLSPPDHRLFGPTVEILFKLK